MASEQSRFEEMSRRTFMKHSLTAGLGVAGVLGLAACGAKSDKDVFAGQSGSTTITTTTTGSAAAGSGSNGSTPAAASGPPLPTGAELRLAFTFAQSASTGGGAGPGGGPGGGPAKNPYIAVWIEDDAESMVQTVSLWIEQGKGQRYWPDMTRWYREDQKRVTAGGAATAQTITGATRTAGTYNVAWNGNRYDGSRAAQGTYYVCIEAAREHGPYELIREPITLGTTKLDQPLTPKGELTAASASYVVA